MKSALIRIGEDMIESLTIKNFAIIDQISIDFSEGMTVLSGETGAGKSIIIDALGILCGGRGSVEFIRHGESRLTVEGLFSFEELPSELIASMEKFGIELDVQTTLRDGLIIRREINQSGKNIIRVNGQLANVTLLKEIGSFLVDIHGQNEHQALLDNQQHLHLLDQFAFSSITETLNAYRQVYSDYQQLRRDWLKAQRNESNQMQRLSFLEFQLSEIEEAELVLEEDEKLEQISKKLQGAQEISLNLSSINVMFSESDTSVLTQVNQIIALLQEIVAYDETYPTLLEQIESINYDLQELAHQIAATEVSDEADNQSIDEVESRLSQLEQLKRKYNMSIAELLEYYDQAAEEVYQIKHREQFMEKLSKQLSEAYAQAKQLADQLHEIRQDKAGALINRIETELADLYMEHSRFSVEFHKANSDNALNEISELKVGQPEGFLSLNEFGYDQIEFYVSTNIGEAMKPLVKVASGGELSRFMLALKSVFGTAGLAKTMVFDEIDTGVSGRVAQAIAEKIHQVSQFHQVLCITHLAQVAAIAEKQLYITKSVSDERTSTQVATLNAEERSEVIAQMMSGKVLTKASLQLAKELLSDYQKKH